VSVAAGYSRAQASEKSSTQRDSFRVSVATARCFDPRFASETTCEDLPGIAAGCGREPIRSRRDVHDTRLQAARRMLPSSGWNHPRRPGREAGRDPNGSAKERLLRPARGPRRRARAARNHETSTASRQTGLKSEPGSCSIRIARTSGPHSIPVRETCCVPPGTDCSRRDPGWGRDPLRDRPS
jgi:hypothetical protein